MRDYNILMIKAATRYFLVVDEISCIEVPKIKKKISIYLLTNYLIKDRYIVSDFKVISNNAQFIIEVEREHFYDSRSRRFISGTIIQNYSLKKIKSN